MTERRLSRVQTAHAALIATIGYRLLATLGSTYRWRVDGYEHYDAIRARQQTPIFAFWHGRILPATYFWRDRDIVVMTSENFDGEWIARIIRRFGYGTARGSSSRGGRRALVQLRREVRQGTPAAFTLDGPRGPARVAQPGAVWLARLTGSPLLPFHIEADRGWSLKSWDRSLVPRPFSQVAVAIGDPIMVGRTSSEAELETTRVNLERSLRTLAERARDMLE